MNDPPPDASVPRRPAGRGAILAVLRLLAGGALVAWILSRTDLAEVGRAFRNADLSWVGVALLLSPLGYACSVRRWQLLLRALGFQLRFGTLLRAFLVGVFFNHLLPSTIGGDALRARESWRAGVPAGPAFAVVLIDRFLGLLALALFAGAALVASALLPDGDRLGTAPGGAGGGAGAVPLGLAVAGLGVLGIVAVRLMFARRSPLPAALRRVAAGRAGAVARLASRGAETLELFRGQGGVVGAAMLLSVGLQAAVVLNYWALARALHAPLPLAELLVAVPLTVVLTSLPISVNGIGVRENVWAAVLRRHGHPNAIGVALSWLDYGLVLLQALVGAALFFAPRRTAPQGGRDTSSEATQRDRQPETAARAVAAEVAG